MFYIGVDDAGRGPVIGPMVLAGVLVDDKQLEILKKLEVKDSKMLSSKQREFLAVQIKKNVTAFCILRASPEEIDTKIANGINLNKIEALKTAEIINVLSKRAAKAEAIIDCPSNNIAAWQNYLSQHIHDKAKVKLRCEHKADVNYPVVSAASILAKVTRDEEVEKIGKRINEDIGSGYPSDPVTVEFLKKYSRKYKDSGIFRKSWQTWKTEEKKKGQRKIGEF